MIYERLETPLGPMVLAADDEGLTHVWVVREPARDAVPDEWTRDGHGMGEAARQMRAYFAGELKRFELPLNPGGTPFQRTVWEALTRIPYGQTTSYGALAASIGKPGASRAVGNANGKNPLLIVQPCHRVIAASGALGGFSSGLDQKRLLLNLELANRGGLGGV